MLIPKICNTKEDYMSLMKNLERYNFHWCCGQKPTDEEVLKEVDYFPVKIYFGNWGPPKSITYSHTV